MYSFVILTNAIIYKINVDWYTKENSGNKSEYSLNDSQEQNSNCDSSNIISTNVFLKYILVYENI